MNFAFEIENNGTFHFLSVLIIHDDSSKISHIICQKTPTDRYLHAGISYKHDTKKSKADHR